MSWTGAVLAWPELAGTPWAGRAACVLEAVADEGRGVVVLDERCPGTTADDVRRVVAAADEAGCAAVGVRPVTDTVKQLQDGYVGATVDRDGLVVVCSPLVLPGDMASGVVPDDDDLPGLVARLLADGVPVLLVEVPARARRLADVGELVLLDDADG